MARAQSFVASTVDLEGPLFDHDVEQTFESNVQSMLQGLADWGELQVRTDIAGHASQMPYYTGWTFGRVIGRVQSTYGRRWHWHAVVSANTTGMTRTDAIRTKAAAATIERRWHPFRRTKSAMYRSRPVIMADLAKGLD